MNGYDAICEAASKSRTTRMPEAATTPPSPGSKSDLTPTKKLIRPGEMAPPRDTSRPRPEFDSSDDYAYAAAAAADGVPEAIYKKLMPGPYWEAESRTKRLGDAVWEASATKRSDGRSSQDRDGGNRYDISTPEKKRAALAAARRSDNPEDLKKLRGKVAESALMKPMRPREAVSSGDFPELDEAKGQLPPWLQKGKDDAEADGSKGAKGKKKMAKEEESGDSMEEAPLNAKRRNALGSGAFALSGRRFPIDTPARARAALARSTNVGPADRAKIIAAVKRRYPGMDVTATPSSIGKKKK